MKALENIEFGLELMLHQAEMHDGIAFTLLGQQQIANPNRPDLIEDIDHKTDQWKSEFQHHLDTPPPAPTHSLTIEEALLSTCDQLHIIGHDVIFGMHLLKLQKDYPKLFNPQKSHILAHNIETLKSTPPGLFHQHTKEQIRQQEEYFSDYNTNATPKDVVQSMIKTLKQIKTTYLGFEYKSQETHLITHAEALVQLHQLGYDDIYNLCLKPWFLRCQLLENLFDFTSNDLKESEPVSECINETNFIDYIPEFNSHQIKTSQAVFNLIELGFIDSEDQTFLERQKLPLYFHCPEDEFSYQNS